VNKRFEILLWLSGCENLSGLSRNGPLVIIANAFLNIDMPTIIEGIAWYY